MNDDLKIKKVNLEHELAQLLESVKDKTEHIETIKIYEHLITQIKEDLETFGQPKQKCKSCGGLLDPWERNICGPCKIADERYEEEED
jgi:hypothetical protein